jgi:hypothetical protein
MWRNFFSARDSRGAKIFRVKKIFAHPKPGTPRVLFRGKGAVRGNISGKISRPARFIVMSTQKMAQN